MLSSATPCHKTAKQCHAMPCWEENSLQQWPHWKPKPVWCHWRRVSESCNADASSCCCLWCCWTERNSMRQVVIQKEMWQHSKQQLLGRLCIAVDGSNAFSCCVHDQVQTNCDSRRKWVTHCSEIVDLNIVNIMKSIWLFNRNSLTCTESELTHNAISRQCA